MKVSVGFNDRELTKVAWPLAKVLTERFKTDTGRTVISRFEFLTAANGAGGRLAGGKALAAFYSQVADADRGQRLVIVWQDVAMTPSPRPR